ncbi:MAG: methionine--tRNA ligase subunit beta, partial [Campylobacteraceae bacterium]|nr:methionine--tRNA ligase subunit beta [Campylobacteraceae bacterium]
SDLGNEFGNLLNRIIGMSGKYSNHFISSKDVLSFHSKEWHEAHLIFSNVENYIQDIQTNRYLEDLWKVLTLANQSITIYEPWVKMKEDKKDEAMALVALVANLLAKVTILLSPIMPKTCDTIAKALGFEISTKVYERFMKKEFLLEDFKISVVPPLFPRIEEELMVSPEPTTPQEPKRSKEKERSLIDIKDFFKSELKIGTILKAEPVPKSEKLLQLQVDIGETTPRQVIAGIKEFYNPDSLVGMQVCIVANLKPATIMGLLSQGMLLAAKDKDGLSLIRPEVLRENGASIG